MAVTQTTALAKRPDGALVFPETMAFNEDEQKVIEKAMTNNPAAMQVYAQQTQDIGAAQVMLRALDAEIKALTNELRESPAFKKLAEKRKRRKAFIEAIAAATQRAEGAILTVLTEARPGSKRNELFKALHNTRQQLKGGE